jgi:hypothetical protein
MKALSSYDTVSQAIKGLRKKGILVNAYGIYSSGALQRLVAYLNNRVQ